MGYYNTTCRTCGGPAIFWSITTPGYTTCRGCDERIKFLQLLMRRANPSAQAEPEPCPPVVLLVMPPCPQTITYTQSDVDTWHDMKVPRSFIRTDEELEADYKHRREGRGRPRKSKEPT